MVIMRVRTIATRSADRLTSTTMMAVPMRTNRRRNSVERQYNECDILAIEHKDPAEDAARPSTNVFGFPCMVKSLNAKIAKVYVAGADQTTV